MVGWSQDEANEDYAPPRLKPFIFFVIVMHYVGYAGDCNHRSYCDDYVDDYILE
jgi:hypothetical protein